MSPPLVCLVTGASSGIGAAVTRRLSADGHRVALTARREGALREVADTLMGEHRVLPVDLARPEAADELLSAVEQQWGGVDVLVSSAGASTSAPFVRTTDEDWQRMLELNLTAPFRVLRRALPGMVERGFGRVVVVASITSVVGSPYVAAYTASKHGVLGLVRSAAAEVAGSGVTVNAVCPGYVDTPMTDASIDRIVARTGRSVDQAREALAHKQAIRRLVSVDEVAAAVAMCVTNGAITGAALPLGGDGSLA